MNELSVRAGQYSHAGVKSHNEDSSAICIPDKTLLKTKGIVAVIADGVSQSGAGREAAEACVRGFVDDYYSTPESWTVKTSARKVLGSLNSWLYAQDRNSSRTSCMLSTLSAIVLKSSTAFLFHIGDTRIIRLRDHEIECLTRDHRSWAAKDKSFLTRAMGGDIHLEIDYRSFAIETDDIYILLTDGVHEYIDEKSIEQIVWTDFRNLEKAARQIVTKALEQGSNDNVTCQIIHVENTNTDQVDAFYQQLTELPFPPPLEAGVQLDGYKVLREIHASKRTQVYIALDLESQEKVILKTPSVNYQDNPAYINQFLNEEWAAKRLRNEHIVKVIKPTARRRFLYSVTEYLQGQTLRQWMHDHPKAELNEIRAIVDQIANGLQTMHRMEMIHRDIKPENIFIDQHGSVKIIDLGSTYIAGIDEIWNPFSAEDYILGTVNYSAPECMAGNKGSYQSDTYSLGVIAYEMLTARLPFGDNQTVKAIQKKEYDSALNHDKNVPVWVDGAIEKAVKKNPQFRYGEIAEFIYDLHNPNKAYMNKESLPLLERNPLGFWRGFALILLLMNLFWISLLILR